jgi:hypothetical protein
MPGPTPPRRNTFDCNLVNLVDCNIADKIDAAMSWRPDVDRVTT